MSIPSKARHRIQHGEPVLVRRSANETSDEQWALFTGRSLLAGGASVVEVVRIAEPPNAALMTMDDPTHALAYGPEAAKYVPALQNAVVEWWTGHEATITYFNDALEPLED